MKSLFTIGAGILFALLGLSGCENNHGDYPKEYIGFDKTIESYTVNRQVEEQDIDIKIIAIEKSQKEQRSNTKGQSETRSKANIQVGGYPNYYPGQKEIDYRPHPYLS